MSDPSVSSTGPIPSREPPSLARLIRSLLIAAAVAAGIVVTIVLPAEYGVDPTGIGRALGLKEMGEIKQRLIAEEAAHLAEQAADSAAAAANLAPNATTPDSTR